MPLGRKAPVTWEAGGHPNQRDLIPSAFAEKHARVFQKYAHRNAFRWSTASRGGFSLWLLMRNEIFYFGGKGHPRPSAYEKYVGKIVLNLGNNFPVT